MKWRECQTISRHINKRSGNLRRLVTCRPRRPGNLQKRKRKKNEDRCRISTRTSGYPFLFIDFIELDVVFRAYPQTMEAFVCIEETPGVRYSAGHDG